MDSETFTVTFIPHDLLRMVLIRMGMLLNEMLCYSTSWKPELTGSVRCCVIALEGACLTLVRTRRNPET